MVFLQKQRIKRSGPSALLYRIEKIIRDHAFLHHDDKVIVGVSGGCDYHKAIFWSTKRADLFREDLSKVIIIADGCEC